MKFFIQQVHQEQFEIDIPQDTTLEQLRKLLVSQYSYPDQQMKFINNGNILKDPNGLMNVKEFGRIIVYIKNKDSKKSHKRSKKIHSEENAKEQEKNAEFEEKSEKESGQQKIIPENAIEEQNNPNGISTNVTNNTNSNNNENSVENSIENNKENNNDENSSGINNNTNNNINEVNNKNDDEKATNESSSNQSKSNESNSNENKSNGFNYNEGRGSYHDSFELANMAGIPGAEPLFIHLDKRNNWNFRNEIPKEQIDLYLSDCFKKIHLKQLYDEKCNFYANLNETRRIADMIDHNPGLNLVIYQFTKENFSLAIQRKTIDLESAMELAGFVFSSPISIADDYDAMYSEMPNIYTEIVQKLMKKYEKSQRETVKAFVEANYDEQEAEKLLQN